MAQNVEGEKSITESEEAITDLSKLRLNARKEYMALEVLSGHNEVEGTPRNMSCTLP